MSEPLFDSLTHPLPDGNWLAPRYDGSSRAELLVAAMEANRVPRVLAVGMGSVGGYREADYAAWVRANIPGALPVAWFEFDDASVAERALHLQRLGYCGIKVHPRRAGIDFRDPRLLELLRVSKLPVLLCTYPYEKGRGRAGRRLDDLLSLLDQCGDARVVLLHGGLTECLAWSEALRPYRHVLLDLSYTLTHFAGSSLDLDLRWLFHHFDQRICVGSDHPELSLADFRTRFDELREGLDPEKAANIAHGNLSRCFGLEPL